MKKSSIVAYFLFSFVVGILLRSFVVFDIFYLLIVILVGVIGAIVYWRYGDSKKRYFFWLLLGSIFIFLGFLRFEMSVPLGCDSNSQFIGCLNGRNIEVTGVIDREPDVRAKNIQYRVKVDEYEGKILLFGHILPEYDFGDRIRFKCRFEQPENIEDFNYPGFLAKSNIYSVCFRTKNIEHIESIQYPTFSINSVKQRVLRLKDGFSQIINRSVRFPQSTFLSSILLGLRREVPVDIIESFAITGTSHLMAVSGLHIMILITLLYPVFRWLRIRKKYAIWPAVLLVIFFIFLVGFRASALRAGIFGIVGMLAFVVGRPGRALNLLLLASSVLLLINPMLLRYDVGFQLSFLAVLGLMYLGNYIKHWLREIPNISYLPLRDILVMTLSAQLFVMPWLLYQFGNLSIVAPLANILVLPLIPLIMGLGFVLMLGGLVWWPVAQVVGLVEMTLVGYVLKIIKIISSWPLASWAVSLPLWFVLVIYVILISILVSSKVREKIKIVFGRIRSINYLPVKRGGEDKMNIESVTYDEVVTDEIDIEELENIEDLGGKNILKQTKGIKINRVRSILFLGVILLILFIVVLTLTNSKGDKLKIIFLDIGQGDSHLIITPGGHNILIDGGPDGMSAKKISKYLPWHDRTIDLMVLTHPHADHVAGLVGVLERYDVRRVLTTGVKYKTVEYETWRSMADKKEIFIDYTYGSRKYIFETEAGSITLQVLYPNKDLNSLEIEDPNESSVVLLLDYKEVEVLLTGDMYINAERWLIENNLLQDIDILKVAHHGSDTSTSEDFLEEILPEYAVISLGENNYGHPSQRVIRRLERIGAKVLRTDEVGDVVFVSNGQDLVLEE